MEKIPLVRPIKKTKERAQVNKIRHGSYNRYHNNTKIMRDNYKQLHAKKLDSLEEMDKFLER